MWDCLELLLEEEEVEESHPRLVPTNRLRFSVKQAPQSEIFTC